MIPVFWPSNKNLRKNVAGPPRGSRGSTSNSVEDHTRIQIGGPTRGSRVHARFGWRKSCGKASRDQHEGPPGDANLVEDHEDPSRGPHEDPVRRTKITGNQSDGPTRGSEKPEAFIHSDQHEGLIPRDLTRIPETTSITGIKSRKSQSLQT
jgi:hypothetical protein